MLNFVRAGGEAAKHKAVRQALLARYKTAEVNYTYLKVCSSEHRVWHALEVGAQDDFPWLLLDVSMDAALDTPRYAEPVAALNSCNDTMGGSDHDDVGGVADDTSGDHLEGCRSSIPRSPSTSSPPPTNVWRVVSLPGGGSRSESASFHKSLDSPLREYVSAVHICGATTDLVKYTFPKIFLWNVWRSLCHLCHMSRQFLAIQSI